MTYFTTENITAIIIAIAVVACVLIFCTAFTICDIRDSYMTHTHANRLEVLEEKVSELEKRIKK